VDYIHRVFGIGGIELDPVAAMWNYDGATYRVACATRIRTQTTTAMKAAFKKAGIKSPADRLQDIAIKAMVKRVDDTNATIEQSGRRCIKRLAATACASPGRMAASLFRSAMTP
jgi:hypothetical protein